MNPHNRNYLAPTAPSHLGAGLECFEIPDSVYQATQREQWLGKIGEVGMRQRAAWLS